MSVETGKDGIRVAILGATGLVGREMIGLLERQPFPVAEVRLLASARFPARKILFAGEPISVEPARPESLEGIDIVLSSAGGDVSRRLLPHAAAAGAICIDNTSAFRMDPSVPLVVPEINGRRIDDLRLRGPGAIIANPNCSTIQLVMALAPIHRIAEVRRVVVSTYQSISGAGRRAKEAFRAASEAILSGRPAAQDGTAAFDAVPEIGGLVDDGDSTEELKMIRETPKILEADMDVDACCVRVPVFTGHAESVLIETARPVTVESARRALSEAEGVTVAEAGSYPTPRGVAGESAVHVGRIRRARTVKHGLQLWIAADNLLKGAALNAVQIATRIANRSREGAAA